MPRPPPRGSFPGPRHRLRSDPPFGARPSVPLCLPLPPTNTQPISPSCTSPDPSSAQMRGPFPGRRRAHGPRRLRQRRAGRHQVVDEDDRPTGAQQPATARHHGQRTGQVLRALPGVEVRLVGHGVPLPQHRPHPDRRARPPQLRRGGEREAPHRIVPARPHRPARRRHGHEQHGPPHVPRGRLRDAGPSAVSSRPPARAAGSAVVVPASRSPARTAPASAAPSGAVRASTPRSLWASSAARTASA